MKMPAKNNVKIIYDSYNSLSMGGMLDDDIINVLFNILHANKVEDNLTLNAFLSQFNNGKAIDHISLIELIGLAHQKKKEKQTLSNTDERKHNGIYYTNYVIAKRLAEDTLSLFGEKFDPTLLTFLEPCSGSGIFAIAYLDAVFQVNKEYLHKAQKIVDNMYFADIDKDAIDLLKKILPIYLKSKYGVSISISDTHLYVGDTLFNQKNGTVSKVHLKSVFNVPDGFDIVLTNPPYKLLKANSNKYNGDTDNYKKQITKVLNFIRANNLYKYNSGTLNLYKLFVEEILESLTKDNAKIGLLIPSTLLSDKQSYALRNRILEKYSFSTIYTIPEKNNYFLDICQAFCFFSIDKGKQTKEIRLKINIVDNKDIEKSEIKVNKSDINSISSQQEIVSTDNTGWKILNKIHKNKKLSEIASITNLRGELDLTLDKRFITNENTKFPLLKGNGIKEFTFSKDDFFVHDNFVEKLNGKARYLSSERIVCQQISNINQVKRLKFSKIPKSIVLGNSCNFIATNSDTLFGEADISLDYLLGILNSLLLNWRFQLTSSNNHIGNYELNELPIATPDASQRSKIEGLVKKLLMNPNNLEGKAELNRLVFEIYGLDKNEALYILEKHQNNEVAMTTGNLINQI